MAAPRTAACPKHAKPAEALTHIAVALLRAEPAEATDGDYIFGRAQPHPPNQTFRKGTAPSN